MQLNEQQPVGKTDGSGVVGEVWGLAALGKRRRSVAELSLTRTLEFTASHRLEGARPGSKRPAKDAEEVLA